MGAHPYWYFVPYQPDLNAALQALRRREFKAGRYNPVVPFLDFPLGPDAPKPGPQHASIDEAREAAAEDGTRSILDIDAIVHHPRPPRDEPPDAMELAAFLERAEGSVCKAAPLAEDDLRKLFGTTRPTRQQIEVCEDLFEQIDRGEAIYIVVYDDGEPAQIYFAGYSFD